MSNSPRVQKKDDVAGSKTNRACRCRVPAVLGELLNDPDPIKLKRVMKAMLQMYKINIETLKQAYKQG